MSDLINKQIRFPDRHYVGMVGRGEDEVPLAFMTEDGSDQAAEKRKATVDQWVASSQRYHKTSHAFPSRSYDNRPLIGFRLDREIRRNSGWGSGNVMWRIEDPRGFGLEISSPNMAQIMDCCVIDNGEILQECIWARFKGNNVLVPLDSELYRATQENSERLAKDVSLKEVQIGDEITLKNGTRGRYLGKAFELTRSNRQGDTIEASFLRPYYWDEKSSYLLLVDGRIQGSRSLKVAEINKRDPLTAEEAETIANQTMGAYRQDIYSIKRVGLGPVKRLPVPFSEGDRHFVGIIEDRPVIFSGYQYSYQRDYTFYVLDQQAYEEGRLVARIVRAQYRYAGFGSDTEFSKFTIPKADIVMSEQKLDGFEMEFTTSGGSKYNLPI